MITVHKYHSSPQICCVSPASINYDETLASLRFAERAKKVCCYNKAWKIVKPSASFIHVLQVENRARVNVDPAAERIAALMAVNAALNRRVTVLEALLAAAGYAPNGMPLPRSPPGTNVGVVTNANSTDRHARAPSDNVPQAQAAAVTPAAPNP
jgi:hypothetical protein